MTPLCMIEHKIIHTNSFQSRLNVFVRETNDSFLMIGKIKKITKEVTPILPPVY
jgi:hypothetical protein